MTADVVALDLLIGVDDMATVDIGRGVRHRQRAGFEPRDASADPHRRAIPTPPQGKPETLATNCHERQVKVEEVVAFDHVGVELAQPLRHPLQQLHLIGLERQDLLQTDVGFERDDDDLAFRVLGVESRRLDIDLQPLEVRKDHLLEKCAATAHEILLDRRAQAEEPLARVLSGAHGVEMARPVGKLDEIAQRVVTCECLHAWCTAHCLPWFRSFSQEPRRERRVFADHTIVGAPVESDPVRAELLDRDDARGGVVTIEEIRGVSSGRVGEGMRTLVHTDSLLGTCLTISTQDIREYRQALYRGAVTTIASLGTRTTSPSRNLSSAAITSSCSRCCSLSGRLAKPPPSGVAKSSHHAAHSVSGSAISWNSVTRCVTISESPASAMRPSISPGAPMPMGEGGASPSTGGKAGPTMRDTRKSPTFSGTLQTAIPIRPPGRSTRRISRSARSCSGTNINPNWQ